MDKKGAEDTLATAKAALTLSINAAQAAHDDVTVVEGPAAGNTIVGSKATLASAIDAAKTTSDNSAATAVDLNTAKSTLDTAVTAFKAAKVAPINGLNAVAITGTASDSSNTVTLNAGETLQLASSDETKATVTEDPNGTIKVTGVVAGTSTITVKVLKGGQVIKVGTFTVTVS